MNRNIQLYKDTYDKYQNLKLAAQELGIKWQTLYWHLREANHPVTGNKEKYGSLTDKLARSTEKMFNTTVPFAKDMNKDKFQAKVDFYVKGYKVDVKASTKKIGSKNSVSGGLRWAFCCSVQENCNTDFLVCYCYSGTDAEEAGNVEKILLIPHEFFNNMQSISCSCRKSKWHDFEVSEEELFEFFNTLDDK